MRRRYTRWVVLTALGVLGLIGLVLAAVALIGPVGLLANAPSALPVGWIVPLGSLFVIVGVTWLLLSQAPASDGRDSVPFDSVTCPSCGRLVMIDWRLCPYCGAMMPQAVVPGEGAAMPDKPKVVSG